jgi:hypothetical protein
MLYFLRLQHPKNAPFDHLTSGSPLSATLLHAWSLRYAPVLRTASARDSGAALLLILDCLARGILHKPVVAKCKVQFTFPVHLIPTMLILPCIRLMLKWWWCFSLLISCFPERTLTINTASKCLSYRARLCNFSWSIWMKRSRDKLRTCLHIGQSYIYIYKIHNNVIHSWCSGKSTNREGCLPASGFEPWCRTICEKHDHFPRSLLNKIFSGMISH